MNFTSAVIAINKLLRALRPNTFGSSWIRHHAPDVYSFIQKNVRAESGGVDWDRFTRALDRKLQRRWKPSRRGRLPEGFRDKKGVEIILKKYRDKLYTFLSPADANDRQTRDIISIALVRIAQHGNLAAKQEIMKLLRYTVDEWIEQHPREKGSGLVPCRDNPVRCLALQLLLLVRPQNFLAHLYCNFLRRSCCYSPENNF